MTAPAILKESDARRLAKVAAAFGIAIVFENERGKITFLPSGARPDEQKPVDRKEPIPL